MFEICNETEAKRILETESYWFKLGAYCTLYDKQVEGDHVGDYINLDFAYLVDLTSIDNQLRRTLLPLTLDVEHYAMARLEHLLCGHEEEDGYSVVRDYWDSLSSAERKRRYSEIARLKRDYYCAVLLRKYHKDMPAWVFMELLTLGAFIDFYRFCARRWESDEMQQEHYLLRAVKSARNAYAHSACTINNFKRRDGRYSTHLWVNEALERTGASKASREKWLRSTAFQQIATLMYSYTYFVSAPETVERARNTLAVLVERIDKHEDYYRLNNTITSAFAFLKKLFDMI